MRFPFSSMADAAKVGLGTAFDTESPVRVAVYLDDSAAPQLVQTIRDAFVPRTTSAILRVDRLRDTTPPPKTDTDVVLVLTSGSEHLERCVQRLVIAGAPVCVVCESSVEAPFIESDSPMLGMVAATDKTHLLDELARWILDRTDKDTAFASNFPFMRIAACMRIITSTAVANAITGAIPFIAGSNFPVMALAEVGMQLKLAGVFGNRLRPERAIEGAAAVTAGFCLRQLARAGVRQAPGASFAIKPLVAGIGTYTIGRTLMAFYEHGVDYQRLRSAGRGAVAQARALWDTVRTDLTRARAASADASVDDLAGEVR